MRTAIIALAVAGAVSAQSDNSALIPSNITSSCSSFLTTLNSDSTLQDCVTPLINATSAFSPSAPSNISERDINYALASLCKSDGCADTSVRQWLSGFYSNCSAELTSTTAYNAQVRELYDVLYVVNPLRSAVCAIDSGNQEYCVKKIVADQANSTSSSNSSSAAAPSASGNSTSNVLLANFAATWSPVEVAANNLYIAISVPVSSVSKRFLNLIAPRQSSQQAFASIVTPNTTTYRNTNLPFLFLQPSMPASTLCTPCTREVMVSYIKWEVAYPYALGLSQSPILGGQSELWTAINSTCGASYIDAITTEVGISAQQFNNMTSGASAQYLPSGGVGGAVLSAALVAGVVSLFA